MTFRLRRDGDTGRQFVVFSTNDFEIDRSSVPILMEDAYVSDKIDIASAVGLKLRFSRPLFSAFAVANMNVFDAMDDGGDGFYGILIGSVNVTGVHVEPESGRIDGI